MGGDLRYHICQKRKFTEEESKFILACLINALEYLHSNGVLHRDIKPENLVFDSRGYLRLTDLGVARVWKPENSQDTSGTPGYMAPEVMCRQNHGVAVDYYALGVMAYEFMFGKVTQKYFKFNNLFLNIIIATIHWKNKKRNTRQNIGETSLNKEKRYPRRLVFRSSRFY